MRAPFRVVARPAAAGLMVLCAAALFAAQYFQPQGAITVTNTNDSGPGSLRQALVDVPDAGTVQFSAALNGQTITLTTAELVISKSIYIIGPGPALLTVSRSQQAPQFRVFNVMSGHTSEIIGLTISGGRITDSGGGILNDHSTLTLTNCTISGNTVLNNTSTGNNPSGGGIRNSGTMTLNQVTVNGNHASYNGGNGLPTGGGISNDGTMTIIGGAIQSNTGFWSAGGITNSGMMTITGSTISGNETDFPGHFGGGGGGGILNGGQMTIQNSTISANIAVGGDISGGGFGGGIYNGGPLELIRCSITGNRATRGGGGIFGGGTITDSVVSNNQTVIGDGGGISGNSTITNSTITGNSAPRGGGFSGGGNIAHTTFSNNSANQGGGALYVTSATELGDAILKAGASGTNILVNGGTLTTHGYNLSSDNGGGFLIGPGDQINTDPLLGPLQNNGGPTSTQALLPGSPAIHAGNPNFTPPPSYDQRGFGYVRVYNGRIDIGSFEVQPLPTVSPTPTAGTPTPIPTPTPTPTPTPCLPTLTQSTSQSVTIGNSASCNDGNTHTDNSYWRAFDMTAYAGGGQYCINSVSFGVEFANTTQPVTVRLYTTSNFPTGGLTLIGNTTINVGSAQNGTIVTAPLVAVVPAGTPQLVMELFTPNGQPGGYRFFVGSNAALETGSSFFSAPACGIPSPVTTASVGFPNMHIVFDINGTCTCASPTPTQTPCPLISISGAIGQCTTTGPSGVALATVTITRTCSWGDASTLTDSSGNYTLSGFSCVTNTLTPTKAPRPAGSQGIDTVDVLAVQRHFLLIGAPLSGCRLTAADCAPPTGITTGDVIAIQRYFLFFTTGIGNVGQYNFTPPNRIYPPPISNQIGQNYDAIVFGDVSAPYAIQ